MSPVIATTIIIAITVALGLGLWAFANSGVSSATQSYSDNVKQYGDFTKDKFIISNINFDTTANRVSLWIFNSGRQESNLCNHPEDPTICQTTPPIVVVERGMGPLTPTDFCQHDPSIPANCLPSPDFTIPAGGLSKFSFTFASDTISLGKTYEITIFSNTGASTSILKCNPLAGETTCT